MNKIKHRWTTKHFTNKDMTWWDPNESDPFLLSQIEALRNILDKRNLYCILEIGIGRGRVTSVLENYASLVIGIEISPEAIRLTRARAPNLIAVQGDAQKLPFRSESFDGIICWDTFMHFPEPMKFYEESHRTLKDGGMLVFNFLRTGSRGHRWFLLRRFKNFLFPGAWVPDYHYDNTNIVIAHCRNNGFTKPEVMMEKTSVPILKFVKSSASG